MSDKPIIFSGPMVRALIEGRKTQTRRVLKPQPVPVEDPPHYVAVTWEGKYVAVDPALLRYQGHDHIKLPYAIGDRLFVLEEWCDALIDEDSYDRVFRADDNGFHAYWVWERADTLPRHASRLTLTVTDVKVERLQEISGPDICAEGLQLRGVNAGPPLEGDIWKGHRNAFVDLWNTIYGRDAWDGNPWVCALTFTVEQRNIDAK